MTSNRNGIVVSCVYLLLQRDSLETNFQFILKDLELQADTHVLCKVSSFRGTWASSGRISFLPNWIMAQKGTCAMKNELIGLSISRLETCWLISPTIFGGSMANTALRGLDVDVTASTVCKDRSAM